MKKHIRIIHPAINADSLGGRFRQFENEQLKISFTCLDYGPDILASRLGVALATPDTCAKAKEAEREGVDALVIDCMGDVGCHEARESVSIPVLGPYETSLHVAGLLGHSIGVATMVDEVIGIMEIMAKQFGTGDKLAAIRAIQMSVAEMEADPGLRDQRLVEVSEQLVKIDGAGVVILGCAEMQGAEKRVSAFLAERGVNVPIIEPVSTTIMIAAALVDAGLTHSKQSFPEPRINQIAGYDKLAGLIRGSDRWNK